MKGIRLLQNICFPKVHFQTWKKRLVESQLIQNGHWHAADLVQWYNINTDFSDIVYNLINYKYQHFIVKTAFSGLFIQKYLK